MAKSGFSRGLFLLLVLLLAGGAAVAYALWGRSRQTPPEITSLPLARGDVIQKVTATGDLQPVTTIDVSSQISGLIKEVLVDFNTPVTKDQVLAQIDPATYEQRLRQAQAELASAEANGSLVRMNTERIRELRGKNLVSQQELDQAEAQLAQANAQLMTRQAAVEDARVNLARCTLRAPIDGIVISREAEPGKTVAASLNAPTLFVIVNDLTKMEINAAVAEADIGNVEVGQPVNFTVDAFPGRQFRGRVSQIRNSPKVNQNVVTYETIVDVSNDDLKLKPGMTANVSILTAQHPNVLRLPNSALRVRVPEEIAKDLVVTTARPAAAGTDAKAAPLRPATDEERRAIMREAGVTFGPGGPPAPEALERAREIAAKKGIDPASLRGSRGRQGPDPAAAPGTPITRTVYRVANPDPAAPTLEAVTVRLGISDGTFTEVLAGLDEGDRVVTSIYAASAPAASGAANPFAPTRGMPRR